MAPILRPSFQIVSTANHRQYGLLTLNGTLLLQTVEVDGRIACLQLIKRVVAAGRQPKLFQCFTEPNGHAYFLLLQNGTVLAQSAMHTSEAACRAAIAQTCLLLPAAVVC